MVENGGSAQMTYSHIDKRNVAALAGILLLLCGCKGSAPRGSLIEVLDWLPFGDRVHFSLFIKKGMTDRQVVDAYGTPPYVYAIDSAGCVFLRDMKSGREEPVTKDQESGAYAIRFEGYTAASAPISHQIYVYLGGFDAIAYVYIGSNGRVERVEIGGT